MSFIRKYEQQLRAYTQIKIPSFSEDNQTYIESALLGDYTDAELATMLSDPAEIARLLEIKPAGLDGSEEYDALGKAFTAALSQYETFSGINEMAAMAIKEKRRMALNTYNELNFWLVSGHERYLHERQKVSFVQEMEFKLKQVARIDFTSFAEDIVDQYKLVRMFEMIRSAVIGMTICDYLPTVKSLRQLKNAMTVLLLELETLVKFFGHKTPSSLIELIDSIKSQSEAYIEAKMPSLLKPEKIELAKLRESLHSQLWAKSAEKKVAAPAPSAEPTFTF